MKTEIMILSRLLYDQEFARKVLPFILPDYFQDRNDKIIFTIEASFFSKYNKLITKEALLIELEKLDILKEDDFEAICGQIRDFRDEQTDLSWCINQTEEWCKDQALHNALLKSISLAKDEEKSGLSKGAIPQILQKALSVSFDTKVGHDYIADAKERFDYYHDKCIRIPLPLDIFNDITNGGLPEKTLNLAIMATYTGKTLMMCNFAAHQLILGYNVLYITLEISEKEIGKRIDCQLLEIPIEEMEKYPSQLYFRKVETLKSKTNGKLKIKEYPTGVASVNNFKHLLHELEQKENFRPQIIYVDYLNLCSSAQVKLGNKMDSYSYYKFISEELRAMAIEYKVPVMTAMQLNRSGSRSSDPEMSDVAESFGTLFCADFIIAGYTNDQLKSLNQIALRQLKNRYKGIDKNERFNVGVDKQYMKYYEIEQSKQYEDDVPVMDKTTFGQSETERKSNRSRFNFKDIK